jgi:DNA-binding response OmpR family regulator
VADAANATVKTRPSILIVENDTGLREAVALVLSQEGYEVVIEETGTGEKALHLMKDLSVLDGLYTDINLDDCIDGWLVGSRFQLLWPQRPVVYASAGSRKMPLLGNETFLRKPFEFEKLCSAFRPVA